MFLAKRAGECFLYEVVRPDRVAGQCTGIAPEPWDLPLETTVKIAHAFLPGCTEFEANEFW
jgi:hypothetical protein